MRRRLPTLPTVSGAARGTRGAVARAGTVALIGLVLSVASAVAFAGPAAAAGLALTATIDGQALAHSSESHPIRLSPRQPATVVVRVDNTSSAPVVVNTVRLEGRVAGLTFFAYDTSVDLTVGPRQSTSLQYVLDLGGLQGQATGLIPGSIRLLDEHRHVVAAQSMVSDVRGSIRSVYGLFGLALFLLTGFAVIGALLALARHRLPQNRWLRAARFLTPGLGLGLVLVFTLSAFRIWVPTTSRWIAMVLVCGGTFFVLGYLTPRPVDAEELGEDELDADEDPTAGRHFLHGAVPEATA